MARPKETIDPEIGKRLKLVREKGLRITQEELAEMFEVTTQTISNWESGRRKVNTDMLRQFAEHFDISLDYLLNKSDEIIKPDFSKYNELAKEEKTAERIGVIMAINKLYDFYSIPNTNSNKAQDDIGTVYDEIFSFIKFKYDYIYSKYNNDNSSN